MIRRLIKVFFKENFSLDRIIGTNLRKNRTKAVLLGLLILYAFGVFMFSFGFLFFNLGEMLAEASMTEQLLSFLYTYLAVTSIIFVLVRANGYLFKYKDFQLLESLPLKTSQVLAAKTSVFMIFLQGLLLIVSLPIAFSYFYHAGFDIVGFLLFLVMLPFLPLIFIVVFAFVSLLIARLTAPMRNSNLFNLLSMLLFFLLIMGLGILLNISLMQSTGFLSEQRDVIVWISDHFYPVMWFMDAIHDGNVLSAIYLLLSHMSVFVLFLYLVQPLVKSTNQKSLTVRTKTNAKPAKSKQSSITWAIIKKEFRKFISVPIYAINAGFGLLLMVVMGVGSFFFKDDLMSLLSGFSSIDFQFEILILLVLGFCLIMLYTPAISLSLEGKNFWIIKSLPLPPLTVMNAKMLFNILLGLPIALFSLTLLCINFGIGVLGFVAMATYLVGLSFATSVMGSITNLYFPKIHYVNETEVVKQSVGGLIGIFGGFGLLAINGVIFYQLMDDVSWETNLFVNALPLFVFFAVGYFWLQRVVDSQFKKIS